MPNCEFYITALNFWWCSPTKHKDRAKTPDLRLKLTLVVIYGTRFLNYCSDCVGCNFPGTMSQILQKLSEQIEGMPW